MSWGCFPFLTLTFVPYVSPVKVKGHLENRSMPPGVNQGNGQGDFLGWEMIKLILLITPLGTLVILQKVLVKVFKSFSYLTGEAMNHRHKPFQVYNRISKANYRQTSNIKHTKSQNFNVSRRVLQLSLHNLLKPGVQSRMKMYLEQRWEAMLQLDPNDWQFYCLLRCALFRGFEGSLIPWNQQRWYWLWQKGKRGWLWNEDILANNEIKFQQLQTFSLKKHAEFIFMFP